MEIETSLFTLSVDRPHLPPLLALPPRQQTRNPRRSHNLLFYFGCKVTKKNRYERMSKNEISKKNRPPKGRY
nr:MAG TPA: hypothetical protein [Caudoviricetes sp.]